jgi:hypothetical protein
MRKSPAQIAFIFVLTSILDDLSDLALALLALLQSLSGTVKGVSVVATELGVDTLEGGVTVGLGLLDTVREVILAMFPSSRSHVRFWQNGLCRVACAARRSTASRNIRSRQSRCIITRRNKIVRTRYGEPSGCGGAERRSLTLKRKQKC